MLSTAIILAGGFGTRLQSVVNQVPKSMAPVNQKPFLHYQFLYLKHYNFKNVILSVGYLNEQIENYFGAQYLDINITYAKEDHPLGTGGGIRHAITFCKNEEVLVLNGDSFFDCNLNTFFHQHQQNQSEISLALRKVDNASRYGTIEINSNHQIISFKEKSNLLEPGLINAGIYILNKKLFLNNSKENLAFSIETDFFEKQISQLNLFGFEFDGYFIDIGLPQTFKQAQNDFERFKYQ